MPTMVTNDTHESPQTGLIQSQVVNWERGNYNSVSPSKLFPDISTPNHRSEISLRHTPFLTPVSRNNSAPIGDDTIAASPNGSEICILQCSPVDADTTDEIFDFTNNDNNEEDEESDSDDDEKDEEIPRDSNGWKICDTKYHSIKVAVNSADIDMKDELKRSVK